MLLLLACTENTLVKTDPSTGTDPSSSVAPDIEVSPSEVRFGEVLLGQEGTSIVTIRNVGDDALQLARCRSRASS